MTFSARRLFVVCLVVVSSLMFGITGPLEAAVQAKFRPAANGIANQHIVVLDVPPDRVAAVAASLAKQHGASVKEVWTLALRGFWAEMPEAAARAMSADRRVRYIEQDVRMYRSGEQDTSTRPLDGVGEPSGSYPDLITPRPLWHLERLSVRKREDMTSRYTYVPASSGSGVNIFIVDSGVLRFHQEFAQSGVGINDDEQARRAEANHIRVHEYGGSNKTYDDRWASSAPFGACEWDGVGVPPRDLTAEYVVAADGEAATMPSHDAVWFGLGDASHATSVASVAAGRNLGVAKEAEIVPVKVMECDGASSAAWFVTAFE